MRSGVQFDSGSFSMRAKPRAISKNVQQSIPWKLTDGDSIRLSISRVKCLYRVPINACPTAAVRSPIGKAFQFPAFAFATNRLNWSCPLKTVPNGKRDSDATATEPSMNRRTTAFQLRITGTTQAETGKLTRLKSLQS